MFSCEIYEIFKNNYFEEQLRAIASAFFSSTALLLLLLSGLTLLLFYPLEVNSFFLQELVLPCVCFCWTRPNTPIFPREVKYHYLPTYLPTKRWPKFLRKTIRLSSFKQIFSHNFSIYITTNNVYFEKDEQNISHILLHLSTSYTNNYNAFVNIPLFYPHNLGNQYPEVFCIHHSSVCHLPVMGSDFLPINIQNNNLTYVRYSIFLNLMHFIHKNNFQKVFPGNLLNKNLWENSPW